jgi:hypothetical protein
VLEGCGADGIVDVDVRVRAALAAGPVEVLAADSILLGTRPATATSPAR